MLFNNSHHIFIKTIERNFENWWIILSKIFNFLNRFQKLKYYILTLINPDSVASPFVVLLLTSSSNDKKTASELQPILMHNYLKPSSLGSYGKNLSSFILGVTPGTVVISIL